MKIPFFLSFSLFFEKIGVKTGFSFNLVSTLIQHQKVCNWKWQGCLLSEYSVLFLNILETSTMDILVPNKLNFDSISFITKQPEIILNFSSILV